VYRISVGGDTYVVSDAQLALEILTTRGQGRFLKAPQVYEPSFEVGIGGATEA